MIMTQCVLTGQNNPKHSILLVSCSGFLDPLGTHLSHIEIFSYNLSSSLSVQVQLICYKSVKY